MIRARVRHVGLQVSGTDQGTLLELETSLRMSFGSVSLISTSLWSKIFDNVARAKLLNILSHDTILRSFSQQKNSIFGVYASPAWCGSAVVLVTIG